MAGANSPKKILEFFAGIKSFLFNAAGNEVKALAENDGTGRAQLILYDGSAQIRAKGEATTGELDIVLHGKDSGSNIDPLRTNANQQLQVEVVGASGASVHVDGTVLTSTPATIYTVTALLKARFEVEVSNATGTSDAVNLWLVESGGSRVAANKRLDAVTVGSNTIPIRLGPYILEAGGTIQASSTNSNNLSIQVVILDES